jgi:hypothetical protein
MSNSALDVVAMNENNPSANEFLNEHGQASHMKPSNHMENFGSHSMIANNPESANITGFQQGNFAQYFVTSNLLIYYLPGEQGQSLGYSQPVQHYTSSQIQNFQQSNDYSQPSASDHDNTNSSLLRNQISNNSQGINNFPVSYSQGKNKNFNC